MSYPIGKARYSVSAPGSKMAMVRWYVEQHPGRAMYHAARYVAPGPTARPGIAYGYATVHRAIKAGLVRGVPGPRGSTLLVPATGFDRWLADQRRDPAFEARYQRHLRRLGVR